MSKSTWIILLVVLATVISGHWEYVAFVAILVFALASAFALKALEPLLPLLEPIGTALHISPVNLMIGIGPTMFLAFAIIFGIRAAMR